MASHAFTFSLTQDVCGVPRRVARKPRMQWNHSTSYLEPASKGRRNTTMRE